MSIIIDRNTSDTYYIDEFDKTFVGDAQMDVTGQLYSYLSDVTFTDNTKRLKLGVQNSNVGDWVYIPNIDVFNSLAISKDFDIIIVPELLRTYDSNYQRILYYTVGIDYNPLRCSQYAKQYMGVLLNLYEGLNSIDETQYSVGTKYMDWQYFKLADPVQCILQWKPTAKKVNADRANYIRWSLDFIFMLMVDSNVVVCGSAPK